MKNIIKLGMLAVVATVSAHATSVTVGFGGSTLSPLPFSVNNSSGPGVVTLRGYLWDTSVPEWDVRRLQQDANGVGVASQAGLNQAVEGTYREFIAIDFAATATGNVSLNSLVLNYPTYIQGTTQPGLPYFKYAWVSTLMTDTASTPDGDTFTSGWNTAATNITGTAHTFTNLGTGRYLVLGAVNGTLNSTNYFQVQSLTYTSVPDGASTLALMGAALATLGFAARRRKL
jgi:hypothetical protein